MTRIHWVFVPLFIALLSGGVHSDGVDASIIDFTDAHRIPVEASPIPDVIEEAQIYCGHARNPTERDELLGRRSIPPLTTTVKDVQIKQVQVLIRHGARTSAAIRQCWPGYSIAWDCQNNELTGGFSKTGATFSFPKQFDARIDANPLLGNCELGQLIEEGHSQHQVTGKALARAYFGAPTDFATTPTSPLFLFDLKSALESNTLKSKIYARSSEYQRTRLSGAELLTSLIKTLVPDANDPHLAIHTVEKSRDTIFPNEDVCYDLKLIENEAFISKAYKEKLENKNAEIKAKATQLLDLSAHPSDWPTGVLDCLYTAMCPGHDLPAHFDQTEVSNILKAVHEEAQFYYRYDDAKYSKLALSRLVYEIKQLILKIFPSQEEQIIPDQQSRESHLSHRSIETPDAAIPFILWSAHDSTVSPFLATFGDKMSSQMGQGSLGDFSFPPYASMLTIESFDSAQGPMVRLVYNNKIMTEFIEGCPSGEQLCPMKHFFTAMNWATKEFAEAPCKHKKPTADKDCETAMAFTSTPFASFIIGFLFLVFSQF